MSRYVGEEPLALPKGREGMQNGAKGISPSHLPHPPQLQLQQQARAAAVVQEHMCMIELGNVGPVLEQQWRLGLPRETKMRRHLTSAANSSCGSCLPPDGVTSGAKALQKGSGREGEAQSWPVMPLQGWVIGDIDLYLLRLCATIFKPTCGIVACALTMQ